MPYVKTEYCREIRENPYWFLWDDHLYIDVALLAERGWTEWMVRRFLGKPDRWGRVNHWMNWTGKRLYFIARVELAEGLPEFRAAFRKAASRRKFGYRAIAAMLRERRATRGVVEQHYGVMTKDEHRTSVLAERGSNLLAHETPRGRVLAAHHGIRPPAFLRRRREGGTT